MANSKVDKFHSFYKYVNKVLEAQTNNDESKYRFMEVVLNYGTGLNESAYEYFELQKSDCDLTDPEYLGQALFQTMMLEDGFKNPSSKDDISRFKGFLGYMNENADPLLFHDLDISMAYDKILTYLINDYLKENLN